jgi:hypothetical protein
MTQVINLKLDASKIICSAYLTVTTNKIYLFFLRKKMVDRVARLGERLVLFSAYFWVKKLQQHQYWFVSKQIGYLFF